MKKLLCTLFTCVLFATTAVKAEFQCGVLSSAALISDCVSANGITTSAGDLFEQVRSLKKNSLLVTKQDRITQKIIKSMIQANRVNLGQKAKATSGSLNVNNSSIDVASLTDKADRAIQRALKTKASNLALRKLRARAALKALMNALTQYPKGDKGDAGEQGIPGKDGADGTNGTNGVDGAVGPQGPQGDPGKDGANGTNGTNGVDGAVGPQGPQGDPGQDGANGTNGTDGVDGAVGPQGPQGPAGGSAISIVSEQTAVNGTDDKSVTATCRVGTIVIGGAAEIFSSSNGNIALLEQYPGQLSGVWRTWTVRAGEQVGSLFPTWGLRSYAICMQSVN